MTKEEYVYAHILEALSGGLYPNKLDVTREYLQNSYDSIREYINKAPDTKERKRRMSNCKITITIKGGSFFIHDNGTGMDFKTLHEYRKIGFSRKHFGMYAGWRGIGKAAGFSISEKLIVTTSKGKGETFQLTFETKKMIDEVNILRSKGENIPFNDLIEKHSQIKRIDNGETNYTNVELHKIVKGAEILLEKNQLIKHLSFISPIPFDPNFEYGKEIEKELESAIDDYTLINLYVEGERIYKPYLEEWSLRNNSIKLNKPLYIPVYDEKKENLIAFCWYCTHTKRGQIKVNRFISELELDIAGLIYRLDDIKIGDSYLTRNSLWRTTTPQLALYVVGEIHVLNKLVEPTSDRNDFIDNNARFVFYEMCREITKEINRKARKLSIEEVAEEKIIESEKRVQVISEELEETNIPKKAIPKYIYELESIKEDMEKRKPATPKEELKELASMIIKKSDEMVDKITDSMSKPEKDQRVYYDVLEQLQIQEEGRIIYNTIIDNLLYYYADNPEKFEDIVRRIDKALIDIFS